MRQLRIIGHRLKHSPRASVTGKRSRAAMDGHRRGLATQRVRKTLKRVYPRLFALLIGKLPTIAPFASKETALLQVVTPLQREDEEAIELATLFDTILSSR